MPEAKCLHWPANLVEDKTYRNKSIYVSDFCTRNRRPQPQKRNARTEETPRYAEDIFNPSSRFLNDHFQTSSHLDLKSHCEKVLNSIDRSSSRNGISKSYEKARGATPIYSGLPQTPVIEYDNSQPLVNVLPATLRRIEGAWQEEALATKRERGYLYGKAGAKKYFNPSKPSGVKESQRKAAIPGVSKWLNEANEFEKQVVHNFMNRVSDSLQDEMPPKEVQEAILNEKQHYSANPKMEDYMDNFANEEYEISRPKSPQNVFPTTDEYFMLDEPYTQSPLLQNQRNVSFKSPDIEHIMSSRLQDPLGCNEMIDDCEANYGNFQKEADQVNLDLLEFQRQQQQQQQKIKRPASCQSFKEISHHDYDYAGIPRPNSVQGRYISDSTTTTTMRKKMPSAKIYQNKEDYKQSSPLRIQSARGYRPIEAIQQRAKSAGKRGRYGHNHNHNATHCIACQDKEIKQMAAQLDKMKIMTYSPRRTEKEKYIDYSTNNTSNGSVFKKISKQSHGHFVIHPEWISENKAPKKSYR
eukprot:gene9856-10867_t